MKKMNLDNNPTNSRDRKVSRTRAYINDLASYVYSHMPDGTLILKGGLLLEQIATGARETVDVDFSITDLRYYEQMKEVLSDFAKTVVSENPTAVVEIKPEIKVTEPKLSGGFKIKVDQEVIAQLDVSLENGCHTVQIYHTDTLGNIVGYTPESVLADKVKVIFSKRRFRRIKDLYDIYMLVKRGSKVLPINLEEIREILKNNDEILRSDNFHILDDDQYPFTSERLNGLEHAWSSFTISFSDGSDFEKPDFNDIVTVVGRFIECLLYPNSSNGKLLKEWE